jgi:hypothetical protein
MAVVVDPRKSERVLYAPGALPVLVDVPDLHFLMIDGEGAPDVSKGYQQAVEALYGVAFAMRFALKREADLDHPVMPLEGLWWVDGGVPFLDADRSLWRWTMMIRQADQVSPEFLTNAIAKASKRYANPALSLLRLETYSEGPAAQVLHTGPYSEERPTIERLRAFISEQGLSLGTV